MHQTSLHQSVFKLVIGLVLITSLTVMLNLWWTTHQMVEQKMSSDIRSAQASITNLMNTNSRLLNAAKQRLIQNPNVATSLYAENTKQLYYAMTNHALTKELDLVFVMDAQGQILANNTAANNTAKPVMTSGNGSEMNGSEINGTEINGASQSGALANSFNTASNSSVYASSFANSIPSVIATELLQSKNDSDFMIFQNRLYQVSAVQAQDAHIDIFALIGVEITAQALTQTIGVSSWSTNVRAFMFDDAANSSLFQSTKVSARPSEGAHRETTHRELDYLREHRTGTKVPNISEFHWYELIHASDLDIGEQSILLDSPHVKIELEIIQSLHSVSADFRVLKSNSLVIMLIAISASCLVAFMYSRRLTKPIRYLANVAKNISLGNYHQKLELMYRSKEFTHLADAIDTMQSNIKAREKQITYQAEHDPLTKLYSRCHASVLIDRRIKSGEVFQAVCINIIGFRDINDAFGYQFGDYCLKVLANRLKLIGGLSAYLGGGQFLWLSKKELLTLEIQELKGSLEQLIFDEYASCTLKVNLAILDCPTYAKDSAELFKRLSIGMDEAKGARQQWVIFDLEIEKKYTRRLSIASHLRRNLASEGEHFSLFYQPKLNLKSQKVESVEALIRWHDPQLGSVSPEEFIQIAEHAGLIGQVTRWVIQRAIQDAKTLASAGQNVCIAINLSARDLVNNSLLPLIIDDLRRAGLSSSALSFEITESDLVKDIEAAVWHLNEYKRAGFTLAIDDFGTGYSSLAYLKSFPVDYLKIDKSFVLQLDSNKNDRDIVETILQLAHRFGLKVIAEGVENHSSLDILALGECDYAQGYLISRPITLADFIEWNRLNTNKPWFYEQTNKEKTSNGFI